MILDDIKTLQNIADTSKDALLTLYIRKAVTLIVNYLNIPTVATSTTDPITRIVTTIPPIDVPVVYPDAVIEYVTICMNKRGNEGIKQSSQGSRSQTYDDSLPSSVRALLPVPFARMMG